VVALREATVCQWRRRDAFCGSRAEAGPGGTRAVVFARGVSFLNIVEPLSAYWSAKYLGKGYCKSGSTAIKSQVLDYWLIRLSIQVSS
jgi:hypothetical protein